MSGTATRKCAAGKKSRPKGGLDPDGQKETAQYAGLKLRRGHQDSKQFALSQTCHPDYGVLRRTDDSVADAGTCKQQVGGQGD